MLQWCWEYGGSHQGRRCENSINLSQGSSVLRSGGKIEELTDKALIVAINENLRLGIKMNNYKLLILKYVLSH